MNFEVYTGYRIYTVYFLQVCFLCLYFFYIEGPFKETEHTGIGDKDAFVHPLCGLVYDVHETEAADFCCRQEGSSVV